jgi:Amidohydrolase family
MVRVVRPEREPTNYGMLSAVQPTPTFNGTQTYMVPFAFMALVFVYKLPTAHGIVGALVPTAHEGAFGLVVNRECPPAVDSPIAYKATVESDSVVLVSSSSMLFGAVLPNSSARTPVIARSTTPLFSIWMTLVICPFSELEQALRAATADAAKILAVDDRAGSLAPGKDADVALFEGDPFEYTSHVLAVLVGGQVSYQRSK